MSTEPALGVMFRCQYPPERLPEFARTAEEAGLDELWVVEDCFFNGGISAAAVALAVTDRITVGIGILPAAVRNAAYTAMDLATLERIFPGRLHAGLGHGVADWLRQVGAFPASQLAALGETTTAIRDLLHGRTVTTDGRHVRLDRVALDHPPERAPLVSLGVTGPKSLALSGRVADGTILVETTSPAKTTEAMGHIAGGQAEAGREGKPHRVTVFAFWSQGSDTGAALDMVSPIVENYLRRPVVREELHELAIAGTAADCARAVRAYWEVGAASVVLVPATDAGVEEIAEGVRALREELDR
jgi:alkanesulfonate monooxygenase SsuD/methylene tetrahydromethanopterin reductase-like flavin-dependent oxidoreductase (luciferase family)